MSSNNHHPLKTLALADPDMADSVAARLTRAGCDPGSRSVGRMVEDVVYGLSLASFLGRALADGYVELLRRRVSFEKIVFYSQTIRDNAGDNQTFAGILSSSLVPVLAHGDEELLRLFLRTAGLMKEKWLYALAAEPLEILTELLGPNRLEAGRAWLELLGDVFAHDLTYNQFRRFAGRFPRAVLSFPEAKRAWRIEQIRRVVRRDFNLAAVLIESLGRELSRLPEAGLRNFVDQGLACYYQDAEGARKFLGLETRSALDFCARLQTSVVLPQMRSRLGDYLQARCGRTIPIKPLSALPAALAVEDTSAVTACCDGKTLYLPDEINRFPEADANCRLYKMLAWVETAQLEFDTCYFDFDRAGLMVSAHDHAAGMDRGSAAESSQSPVDLQRFLRLFSRPDLARDLFTIFEYGRLRTLLREVYPAGVDRYYPILLEEAGLLYHRAGQAGIKEALHAVVALGGDISQWRLPDAGDDNVLRACVDIFQASAAGAPRPEAAALAVWQTWKKVGPESFGDIDHYTPLRPPFDLRVRPELFAVVFAGPLKQADSTREKISQAGGLTFKSDILKKLIKREGVLYADDIRSLLRAGNEADKEFSRQAASDQPGDTGEQQRASGEAVNPEKLLASLDINSAARHVTGENRLGDDFHGRIFRHREWDHTAGDYLDSYVLVREREVASGQPGFYRRVLDQNRGLVKKIRYAFELLKPESVTLLRKWREGEEFDYRELLAFVVDKKAGQIPSERIYVKRLKQERDVAVQLLLDFSRSTSNNVTGSETATVLDIEKEAAVLFCEALTVVGDPYAISGFSGTGRLGVDYYRLKDFGEKMTDDIAGRVEAIRPRRNTRMGAAIRHALAGFDQVPAKTRLLILISDGFPNDVDYKRRYALEDTRRALLEARTRDVHVHSITVNISGDSALDELYGRVGHSVISDVRELPGKLLRIYGRLTG
ncbi:MAG: nitric oxide reductase activation protein NorD [Desulfosudaceae bacterium]